MKIDLVNSVFICGICGREMPMAYYIPEKRRHKLRSHVVGLPAANAQRHEEACNRKMMKDGYPCYYKFHPFASSCWGCKFKKERGCAKTFSGK